MITRQLPSKFKYYIAYAEEHGNVPILCGFEDERERDDAYDNYEVTGELEIFDIITGSFSTLQPILVGKLDLVDGKWLGYIPSNGVH